MLTADDLQKLESQVCKDEDYQTEFISKLGDYDMALDFISRFEAHMNSHNQVDSKHTVDKCEITLTVYRALTERKWPNESPDYFRGLFSGIAWAHGRFNSIVEGDLMVKMLVDAVPPLAEIETGNEAGLIAIALHWREAKEGINAMEIFIGDNEVTLDKEVELVNLNIN